MRRKSHFRFWLRKTQPLRSVGAFCKIFSSQNTAYTT